MPCVFASFIDPNTATASDELELQNAINGAGTSPLRINIPNDILLYQTLTIPAGAKIDLHGDDNGHFIDSASPNTFQLISVDSSPTVGTTCLHISNLSLSSGGGVQNGGAIGANQDYRVEVVVQEGSNIRSNYADNGGAIFVRNGAVKITENSTISDNHATFDGGGIYAPCVVVEDSSVVSRNEANRNGGGIYTQDYTQINGQVSTNRATGNGGGIYIVGVGLLSGESCTVSANRADENGGGIYLASLNSVNAILDIRDAVELSENRAALDGGAIWVAHSELARLKTSRAVVFTRNGAQNSVPNRLPSDDAVYIANILSTIWTNPFIQGYNNFDIAYVPPLPCTVVGQRLVDIALPVAVRPFARVGTVISLCCGDPIIVPEYQSFVPSPSNCDFTIHQKVCVEVPVEFGAEVQPGEAHSECTGESCEECDAIEE